MHVVSKARQGRGRPCPCVGYLVGWSTHNFWLKMSGSQPPTTRRICAGSNRHRAGEDSIAKDLVYCSTRGLACPCARKESSPQIPGKVQSKLFDLGHGYEHFPHVPKIRQFVSGRLPFGSRARSGKGSTKLPSDALPISPGRTHEGPRAPIFCDP